MPPPDPPENPKEDGISDISVTVSWEAVSDADSYTVTFRQVVGSGQEGLCTQSTHEASVSVDAPSTSASIGVGQMLDGDDTTMLRAYTTYSITVVAVSDLTGSSEDSDPITNTTAQISKWYRNLWLITSTIYSTGAAVAPRDVRTTAVSSTEISVQWDGLTPCRHVNGRINRYRVQYTEVGSDITLSEDENGEWNVMNAETSLTGLTPFTNYSIQVAAVNEEGDVGLYSDPLTRQTQEGRESLTKKI